jgi:hypothetical protein
VGTDVASAVGRLVEVQGGVPECHSLDSWLITVAGRPGPKKNQVLQWLPRPPRAPGSVPPLTGIDIRTAFTSIGLGNVRVFSIVIQSLMSKRHPLLNPFTEYSAHHLKSP